MERLQAEGVLTLPAVRRLGPRGPRRVRLTAGSAPQPELGGTAGDYEPLRLTVVQGEADSARWCELVERYHYLGYRVPVGAQLRYLVYSPRGGEQPLACLQWSSGGLEDGGAGELDRLERRAAGAQPAIHRQQ